MMRKPLHFILIGIFFLTTIQVFAQNVNLIDSLKTSLSNAKGKERFELLNAIGFEFRLSHPDSTIYYCEQAYKLGKELNLATELAKPLSFIGLAKAYKGDFSGSLKFHEQAIEVAQKQKDSLQLGYGYNNFGRLFFDQGDLVRAYENLINAKNIFEKLDDKSGLAYVYRSLAGLYSSQGDNEKALEASKQALELRRKIGDARGILSALMELGLVYNDVGLSKNAITSLQEATAIASSISDEISLAEISLALSEIYIEGNIIPEALTEAKNAYTTIVLNDNKRMLARANLQMGICHYLMKDYDAALRFLNIALNESERSQNLSVSRDANLYLGKVYEARNDLSKANQFTNKYLVLKESLQNVDLTRQIERLQFQLEIEKKETENELLIANEAVAKSTIRQKELQNVFLIVVISFVSLMAAVQWYYKKRKKEVNKKLAAQNDEIQQQRIEIGEQNERLIKRNRELSDLNHEKDTLMSIVAHDLKSPLNNIRGLIGLMEMGDLSEEQKKYITLMKTATRGGIDLIIDLLDVHMLEENIKPNYDAFNLHDLLLEKQKEHHSAFDGKNITVLIKGDKIGEIVSDRDYLSRIMDNLISNAMKFSSPNSQVEVEVQAKDNVIRMAIKDQGPGFSEYDKQFLFQKFKKLSARPTGGESSNGLGLAIVKILIDRLGGEIVLESVRGTGSTFIVVFPIQPV